MTIPTFNPGQVLTASGLNTALTASANLLTQQPDTWQFPQTFDGTINQSPGTGESNQGPFLQASDIVLDYIVSGINPVVPSPASLTMTIPAGTAFVLGQRTLLQAAVADTYPASSDTYFSMTNTGQVAYTSVANGATAPAAPANAINLLKVVTSATAITAVDYVAILADSAEQIPFIQPSSLAVVRSVGSKLRSFVSPFDFGAKGDGVTDDTAAIQNAINYILGSTRSFELRLGVPDVSFRTIAPLNIPQTLAVVGEGFDPFTGNPDGLLSGQRGSLLFFDHLGVGLNCNATGGFSNGMLLEKFGTIRNQPTPGTGTYTPLAADYDVFFGSMDAYVNDVMLLNPTNGIKLTYGGYGRLEIDRLRGQPLNTGVYIDQCYDTCKIRNVHFWPFFSVATSITNYTKANLSAFHLLGVDNPQFSDIFAIYNLNGFLFSQGSYGPTYKFHGVNIDIDISANAINVDSSVTSALTAQFSNLTAQSENAGDPVSASLITIAGSNTAITMSNVGLGIAQGTAIDISGTGNVLEIDQFTLGVNGLTGTYVLGNGQLTINGPVNLVGAPAGTSSAPNGTTFYQTNLLQTGSLAGEFEFTASGTLPDDIYGKSVHITGGVTATLPVNSGYAGALIHFYPSTGLPYSIVSQANQFIYSGPLGLNSVTGPITFDITSGLDVLLMARGNGEFDVIGGGALSAQMIYPPANALSSKIVVGSTTTAGAITATAAQLAGQYLADGATQTAAFTVTTDTAANILAAMPNAVIGTAFKWRFINNDQSATGYAGTLAGGTGVTVGTILPNPAVPKGGYEDYVFTFTAIGATPTLTVEAVGGSSAALL